MGAHQADHAHRAPRHTVRQTVAVAPVATRAVATATAVVALSGAGAGIAAAHDGAGDGGEGDGTTGRDAPSRMVTDDGYGASSWCAEGPDLSTAGIDLAAVRDAGCSAGPVDRTDLPDGSGSYRDGGDAGSGSSFRPVASTGQQQTAPRPTAPAAAPVSSNPIDTPPPPGQTRMIKLPAAR